MTGLMQVSIDPAGTLLLSGSTSLQPLDAAFKQQLQSQLSAEWPADLLPDGAALVSRFVQPSALLRLLCGLAKPCISCALHAPLVIPVQVWLMLASSARVCCGE